MEVQLAGDGDELPSLLQQFDLGCEFFLGDVQTLPYRVQRPEFGASLQHRLADGVL